MKAQKKSVWHKLAIIVFLPVIVVVWMVGWTLTVIGSDKGTASVKQTRQRNVPTYKTDTFHEDEGHEKHKTPLEPQIAV